MMKKLCSGDCCSGGFGSDDFGSGRSETVKTLNSGGVGE
ncbi:hypothetical protein A2U01_0055298, partial [Trifolium medium]|nr:hypothetical protein [Trifolium medium]